MEYPILRSIRREVFCGKGVLRNFIKFTGKQLCQSLFFNKAAGVRPANLLKKETLPQVFSCEFCEISKKTVFYRTPPVAAPVFCKVHLVALPLYYTFWIHVHQNLA